MIKNRKAAFGLFVVIFLLFWNLLDFLYAAFITRSGYHFTAGNDMGSPVILAVIIGSLLFLRKKAQ